MSLTINTAGNSGSSGVVNTFWTSGNTNISNSNLSVSSSSSSSSNGFSTSAASVNLTSQALAFLNSGTSTTAATASVTPVTTTTTSLGSNIVQNGSFEADQYTTQSGLTGTTVTSGLTGWQIGGQVAIKNAGTQGALSQEVDLTGLSGSNAGGTIQQTLNTVAGQTYRVSFDVYTGGGSGLDSSATINASFGGNTIASGLQGGNITDLNNGRVRYTYDVTATGTSTNLQFSTSGATGAIAQVDNVAVQSVNTTTTTTTSAPTPPPVSTTASDLTALQSTANRTLNGLNLSAGSTFVFQSPNEVVYVNGDVNLNGNVKFQGTGTIISSGNVNVNGNISYADANSALNVLGQQTTTFNGGSSQVVGNFYDHNTAGTGTIVFKGALQNTSGSFTADNYIYSGSATSSTVTQSVASSVLTSSSTSATTASSASSSVSAPATITANGLLDLTGYTGNVQTTLTTGGSSSALDTGGLYRVDDASGGLDLNGDGKIDLKVGDAGYAVAALQRTVISFSNQDASKTTTATLQGGSYYASYEIAAGTLASAQANPSGTNVYFGFQAANADNYAHLQTIGNTFKYEDQFGGGDGDHNDLTFAVSVSGTAATAPVNNNSPSLGPELVQNGTFEASSFGSTGWSNLTGTNLAGWQINGSVAGNTKGYLGAASQQIDLSGGSDNTSNSAIKQTLDTVAGQTYRVSFDVFTAGNSAVNASFGNSSYTGLQGANSSSYNAATGTTTYSYDVVATSNKTDLSFGWNGKGIIAQIDNVSVKAVTPDSSGSGSTSGNSGNGSTTGSGGNGLNPPTVVPGGSTGSGGSGSTGTSGSGSITGIGGSGSAAGVGGTGTTNLAGYGNYTIGNYLPLTTPDTTQQQTAQAKKSSSGNLFLDPEGDFLKIFNQQVIQPLGQTIAKNSASSSDSTSASVLSATGGSVTGNSAASTLAQTTADSLVGIGQFVNGQVVSASASSSSGTTSPSVTGSVPLSVASLTGSSAPTIRDLALPSKTASPSKSVTDTDETSKSKGKGDDSDGDSDDSSTKKSTNATKNSDNSNNTTVTPTSTNSNNSSVSPAKAGSAPTTALTGTVQAVGATLDQVV